MNANIFRLIFSKRLGMLVPVAEQNSAQGKGGSASGRNAGGRVHVGRSFFLNSIAVGVAAAFSASSLALPTDPSVISGMATFNQVGNVLTVTNSNKAIIDWVKFSIAAGETTRFLQPSASSSVLNRVLSNNPSAIYGTLSSNGQVWLVNTSGILVGPSGVIDTVGFVASTLNVRAEDFLAGRLNFQATPGAGSVVNQGSIISPTGGSVYLIGANVSNEGIITTPQGETILAAGQTVSLIDTATPGVKVDITGAENNATNLGSIVAEAGRIGIAGALVRNGGTLDASSVVSEGGRIFLKASVDTYVDGNGRIVSTGTKGGQVEVLAANSVTVTDNASIDVSGANGGGRIMVGGDLRGANSAILNAQTTTFGPNATLKANATESGSGGTVIVWSDDTTRASGSIEAKGVGGVNGGFVETSGRHLDVNGIRVNTGGGNWLLDPIDLCIYATGYGSGCTSGYSMLDSMTLSGALALGDVTIETYGGTVTNVSPGFITSGTGTGGNVLFSHAYIGSVDGYGGPTWGTTYGGLTVLAYGGGSATGNITVTDSFMWVGGSGMKMVAGWDGNLGAPAVVPGKGNININGVITGTWIQANTLDVIAGNNLTLTGGDVYGGNFISGYEWAGAGALLQSYGNQTITVGNAIKLQAGNADNPNGYAEIYPNNYYGGFAQIWAGGTQTITAKSMSLYGGVAGHDNSAVVYSYGGQQITLGDGTNAGSLWLESLATGTSSNNYAQIMHGYWNGGTQYGAGAQTITINGGSTAGGSATLKAGSGTGTLGWPDNSCVSALGDAATCKGSRNVAEIENEFGSQTLTVNANYGGTVHGTLYIKSGDGGLGNWAGLHQGVPYGGQAIYGSPDITLQGGSGGGGPVSFGGNTYYFYNDAGIGGWGTTTIYANTLTLNGGGAAYGGVDVGGHYGTTVYTQGNLTINGGSTAMGPAPDYEGGAGAGIGSEYGSVYVDVGGKLTMNSNASGAYIGTEYGGYIGVYAYDGIEVRAGTGMAGIGSFKTSAVTIELYSEGNIGIYGGSTSAASVWVGAGNNGGYGGPATVNIMANNLTVQGNTGGALIGSYDNQGTVNIATLGDTNISGYVGIGSMSATYGATVNIYSLGNVTLSGASETAGVLVGSMSDSASPTTVGIYSSSDITADNAMLGVKNPTGNASTKVELQAGAFITDGGEGFGFFTVAGASGLGGNLRLGTTGPVAVNAGDAGNVTLVAYASSTDMYGGCPADYCEKGDFSLGASSTIYGSYISVVPEGNNTIAGQITGTTWVYLDSGWNDYWQESSIRGGDLTITSTGSIVAPLGFDMYAQAGTVTGTGGSVNLQAGSSVVSDGGDGYIWADRKLTVNGTLSTYYDTTLEAGVGGSIAGSIDIGGTVTSTSGDIYLTTYGGQGGDITLGVLNTPNGSVTVNAAGAILDNNGSATNITANDITLTSMYGGSASGLAISTDTKLLNFGMLTASVNSTASYGGIRIGSDGGEGYFTLADSSTYGGPITFSHVGDFGSWGETISISSSYGSDIAMMVTGNLIENENIGIDTSGSALISASGNMEINCCLSNSGSLALTAGNTLTIYGGAYVDSGADLILGAPTIRNDGNVYSSGTTLIVAGDYVSYGGSVTTWSTDADIIGVIGNNMTLYGGYLSAGHDVNLTFGGGSSTLGLFSGAFLRAESPDTIYLNFLGRSSGGILLNGLEPAIPSDYSGYFYNDWSLEATPGDGLIIAYGLLLDPCALSPDMCKPPPPPPTDDCTTNPTLCMRPPDDCTNNPAGCQSKPGEDTAEFGESGQGKKKAGRCKG